MSLEFIFDHKDTCQIKGKFTREYINDIILPAKSFVKDINGLNLYIDLAGVKYSDSSSVALMLLLQLEAQEQNKKIIFKNIPNDINDIIQVSNVSGLLLDHN